MPEKDPLAHWKPRREKSRREVKSRRPSPSVAKRIHHSRGRKWDEFVEWLTNTGQELNHHTLMLMMDGDLFGRWKERRARKIYIRGIYKSPALEDLDDPDRPGQLGRTRGNSTSLKPKKDMDDCPF